MSRTGSTGSILREEFKVEGFPSIDLPPEGEWHLQQFMHSWTMNFLLIVINYSII